jgi:HPt (histidine-containing phosphotransfer) domain-containing protein
MKSRITDLTYLNSISDGDEEFKKDMISTFLRSAPVYLADMKNSLTSGDWKKIGDIAHSMKPSFTLLGMQERKAVIFQLEDYGRNHLNTHKLPELVAELETLIAEASSELRHDLGLIV